jgi:hypothetical protein
VERTEVGLFYVWVRFSSTTSSPHTEKEWRMLDVETEWWMSVHALCDGDVDGDGLLAKCRAALPRNYRRALGLR